MSDRAGAFRSAGRDRPKQTRRRTAAESQREITEIAIRFLWDHPFRDLTIEKVMADTALSRSAFYQHFEDLHHLMETLLAKLDAALRAAANPWVSGEGDPIPALRESLRGVAQVCVEYGPVLRAVAEAAPLDERLERAWSMFLDHWDEAVAARIEAQQRAGLIPQLDARQMACALNRLDVAILSDKLGRRPQADLETIVDTLHQIWASTLYGSTQALEGRPSKSRRRGSDKRKD